MSEVEVGYMPGSKEYVCLGSDGQPEGFGDTPEDAIEDAKSWAALRVQKMDSE